MELSTGQLAALAAVLAEGSFERAAAKLHVSPSAVSQRIKQLEERVGAVLVVRGLPCTPTPKGEQVYRYARQVALLERELLSSVSGEGAPSSVSIAVNADSLATWVMTALRAFTATHGVRVDVVVEDEAHTPALLRSGRVLGVVTSQERAVQGCGVQKLGAMRYVATASPDFVRRWLPEGPTASALAGAPSLAYDRKDDLCGRFLREKLRARAVELVPHYLPSPHAYLEACLSGMAWGLNPEPLAAGALERGELIDLRPGRVMTVPLYWQQWSIASRTADALAEALLRHGAKAMRRPSP